MTMSIQGKTAIVTGAARGIGLAIARHFAEAGANVMFADCDEAALESELGEEARGDGPLRYFGGDLGQKLTLANLVSATIDSFDRVDILVNAHRVVQGSDPLSVSEEELAEMLRQNMSSGLRLSQLVARRMMTQAEKTESPALQNGAIVNVTSLAADWPKPHMLAYSIASAAQAQATRSLASALAPNRIRVNGVAFASIMSSHLQMKLREEPALRERMIAATPLGRIGGADELSETVLFLASEASSFVTGQILRVDGGRSLGDPLAPDVF
ncbi:MULTISPECIES: SDR family NAD(P)-dependent oxidoreductase [unclassified Paracoccus (in: a-proteobacteria)]|uniref:SDR family NAD(P)-dependent oxidoreductase n=1 Tax=unclassified Paracoccus (in: a-proteobacteria) TaxID=2688777 RepID=UPI0012B331F3|nr:MULTISPECIES: SDR family oxidoreductase [unclassified Paracoccus (in: a-proteobacteria)]UXU76383.1 SDR family oxidoreductase [Paracoccus sp. SMMA_5]UXU82279.1 SDR family oxidoreductase [Paracoccus sp. SMMA_5_TC]